MNFDKPVLFGDKKPTNDEATTLASIEDITQAKSAKDEAAEFLLREQMNGLATEEAMAQKERRWKEYQSKHKN